MRDNSPAERRIAKCLPYTVHPLLDREAFAQRQALSDKRSEKKAQLRRSSAIKAYEGRLAKYANGVSWVETPSSIERERQALLNRPWYKRLYHAALEFIVHFNF